MALTLVTSDLIGGLDYSKLTGTIPTWNQNTTGNAATATLAAGATILATARNIGGVSFNGSAAINLPGVNAAGNQPTSGTAAGLSATLVVGSGGTGVTSITSLKNVLDDETWTFANKITSDAGIDIDNFNIDGNTISLSSGNMVIGTASAASALTISDYGLLTMTAGSSSNPRLIFAGADVSGAHFIQINRGESSMQFYVNGDYRATISSSGNVGIGTSSNAAMLRRLNIKPTTDVPQLYLVQNNNDAGGWMMRAGLDGHYHLISYQGSENELLTVKYNNGNVGIGTTSPEQKLHVEGTIQLGNTEQLGWAYDDGSYYNYITNSYNSNDGLTYRSGSWTSNSSIICHSFETYVGDWQKRLVIRQDGNVGIGTTSPSALLEIQTVGTTGNEDFQIFSRGVSPNYEVLKISRSAGSTNLLANQNLTLSADYDNNHGSADSNIYFKTNNDTRLTISSGGLATFSNGIQFGGTPSPAYDSGADTLDAYERGIFTPTNNGDATGTLGASTGEYTRIGNVVHFRLACTISGNFTSNGVGGLPYTIGGGTSPSSVIGAVVVFNVSASNIYGLLGATTSRIEFFSDMKFSSLPPTTAMSVLRMSGSYRIN